MRETALMTDERLKAQAGFLVRVWMAQQMARLGDWWPDD